MSYKPEGYQDAIANMMIKDAKAASSYYEEALGAEKVTLMTDEEMWIGDSCLFFGEEVDWFARKAPTSPGSVDFYLYVPDVDVSFKRAVDRGMTSVSEPETIFWGDSTAVVSDRYHYSSKFSTHLGDVSLEEMDEPKKAFQESMQG